MIGVGNKQTIYQNTDNTFSVPIISVWIRLDISCYASLCKLFTRQKVIGYNGWFVQLLLFKLAGGTAVAVHKKISNSPPGIRTSGLYELIWIMYCAYLGTATNRANSTWLSHQPRANTSYISQKLAAIYNCSEPKWISD